MWNCDVMRIRNFITGTRCQWTTRTQDPGDRSGTCGGVLGGTAATIAVFWFMYEIDHYAVLFILSPLIGNFVFGHFKNKYEFKRYTEQAPDDKVLNYVNRVMYLPDYAKEIRLSNVFSLLKRQYRDATQHKVRTAVKYAFSNASLSFLKITFTFTVIFEGVLLYAIYRNRVTGRSPWRSSRSCPA